MSEYKAGGLDRLAPKSSKQAADETANMRFLGVSELWSSINQGRGNQMKAAQLSQTVLAASTTGSVTSINQSSTTSAPKHQAPNMYVFWQTTAKKYDMIVVDWYCEDNATNTYWAVHQWPGLGYAGFQNKDDDRVTLFSLWDGIIDKPKKIYPKDDIKERFGGEGTGVQIFSDTIEWEEATWYKMAVGVRTVDSKSFYAQWVRGHGKWELTGVICFPSVL